MIEHAREELAPLETILRHKVHIKLRLLLSARPSAGLLLRVARLRAASLPDDGPRESRWHRMIKWLAWLDQSEARKDNSSILCHFARSRLLAPSRRSSLAPSSGCFGPVNQGRLEDVRAEGNSQLPAVWARFELDQLHGDRLA